MTTDRTDFRLPAGALVASQHLEKLQRLGMSSSLFEGKDLTVNCEAFQWYCSNHKGEEAKRAMSMPRLARSSSGCLSADISRRSVRTNTESRL